MATIKEITTMCKEGQLQDAYELAKADMEAAPTDVWAQREMGWAIYYQIKADEEAADHQSLLVRLDELVRLDLLDASNDEVFFDSVLFKLAFHVKNNILSRATDAFTRLSELFSKLQVFRFEPSNGYSFLLRCVIKCDGWPEMAEFLDWWDLDKLMEEDYVLFKLENGKTVMSLAEQAFIAMSKALLREADLGHIEEFLPKMAELVEEHPEMTYPGYYYGKLLLATGGSDDALKVIVPFARKKASEFWVWQLMSEVFVDDFDKQLACLLRAVHCCRQETFLGKVRMKLARLYIQRKQPELAKFHIDKVVHCYLSQGWSLPGEVNEWVRQPWFNAVKSNGKEPLDYMSVTDAILCEGSDEAVAVVTYWDDKARKAIMIIGMEKRLTYKPKNKVSPGDVLKINFVKQPDGKLKVLNAKAMPLPTDVDYAKVVEGKVQKRTDRDFAFLKTKSGDFFIAPNVVHRHDLHDKETMKSLIVYDYNRKKGQWSWNCIDFYSKPTNV